jgi:hypothetical protein
VATSAREAGLEELFARGWTTELFAEFWAAPDLRYIPSIITDDVVGYWPGGRTVRGAEQYMQALEELLALLPDLRLEVPEHTMSPRWPVRLLALGDARNRRQRPIRARGDGSHARA